MYALKADLETESNFAFTSMGNMERACAEAQKALGLVQTAKLATDTQLETAQQQLQEKDLLMQKNQDQNGALNARIEELTTQLQTANSAREAANEQVPTPPPPPRTLTQTLNPNPWFAASGKRSSHAKESGPEWGAERQD